MATVMRTIEVDDVYRAWAPFYPPAAHNDLMRVEQDAMLSLFPDVKAASVLDAGCGTGRYARLAAERGAGRVIAVDRSASMLRCAPGLRNRLRADFARLPLRADSFDVVVSGLALMDEERLSDVFTEWSRVLRSSGAVLCSLLHPRGQALGWTRTFDTPAGKGSLPSQWHSVSDLRGACERAGLELDAVLEPSLDRERQNPVALVIRARRRS